MTATAVASAAQAAPDSDAAEAAALSQTDKLRRKIVLKSWIIGGLTLALVGLVPFTQPLDFYFAMNPARQIMPLVGLTMPNMTNRAVLSWSVNSITEIMTMGFGDMDAKLPKMRNRFTADGWHAYAKAFVQAKIGKQFKEDQLVLTTVPSDTPVIVWQGVNQDNVYQWVVQMPVIMTYATNNNVTAQSRHLVMLTITRVPTTENSFGIAIQSWAMQ